MSRGGSGRPGGVFSAPTRARLFTLLANLRGSATTSELAAELGLHPSGVRVRLERLREAGLVTRARTPQAVGRPRDRWSIAAEAPPGSQPPGAYRQLAAWLARSIPDRPRRLTEVERTGRELGRELGPAGGRDRSDEAMARALSALGFAPRRRATDPGRVTFVLGHCPYRDAVRANQPVVCALHRGLTLGLLDRIGPGSRLANFVPQDPDRAGCLIEIEGPAGT